MVTFNHMCQSHRCDTEQGVVSMEEEKIGKDPFTQNSKQDKVTFMT